ncbi:TRZ/ATZ family hydrolase [Thiolinea disciformis]|uniref:TRZ/ATZ family hydrolase n=1 Tax=Thiolinea disciformis TaxID=125614 RepID=UPI0003756791|nr:TRZ/ATZ family hydrolase [Thiolinea disciformis]
MKIELLIKPRWIITVNATNQVLENHAIVIHQGQIIDLLPATDSQRYQAEQVVELADHALMPGLINAHTHSAMALLKGLADDLPLMEWLQEHIWPAEARWADANFVYDGTQLAIAEMIRSGTTCFNDMYFFTDASLKAVQKAGIRAALGMILIDFPTAYANDPDEYLAKGRALHDSVQDLPLITTLFAPHAPYTVSDQPLLKLHAQAQALNVPIHMHVHETAHEVMQALTEQGERPLARLNRLGVLDNHFLAVHMTQLDTSDITLLANKGVHVIHCPESNLKLASGFCPVADLLEAGVNVALGTDGSASNNDLDMLGEMRTAALIGKAVAHNANAVSATQVLRMATINGAKALNLAEVTGSLEVGKSADMIAIDLGSIEALPVYDPASHIVYCTTRDQVRSVWVAGKCLMNERKLLTLNETELKATAKAWQLKIGEFA